MVNVLPPARLALRQPFRCFCTGGFRRDGGVQSGFRTCGARDFCIDRTGQSSSDVSARLVSVVISRAQSCFGRFCTRGLCRNRSVGGSDIAQVGDFLQCSKVDKLNVVVTASDQEHVARQRIGRRDARGNVDRSIASAEGARICSPS